MSTDGQVAPDESLVPLLVPIRSTDRAVRFRFDPQHAAILRDMPLLSQHARNRGVVRRFETIYFDTADRLLFGHDLSLRVRRQGRRFVQRLARHDRAGMAAPLVWEWPLGDAVPDLGVLSAVRIDGLKRPLAERLAAAGVGSVFETRLRRHISRLDLPGGTMDVIIDDGSVESGGQVEPLHRIALVLRDGEPSCLFEFATRLREAGPLLLDPSGIVRRGHALASGVPMRAFKAEPSAPAAAQDRLPTDELIAAILQDCQTHLLANQPVGRQGRNPDGVHQMRVALRRLRSALTLYHREIGAPMLRHFAGEAKWAAGELGDARAWDVLLTSTIAEPRRLHRSGADFDHLAAIAEPLRQSGYRRVRAMLDDPRYDRFQLALSLWVARRSWRNEVDGGQLAALAEPAEAMAARILGRLQAKALRQGKGFRRLTPVQRHELRITCKKLRYACEFFMPLFDDSQAMRRYSRLVGRLQEALGLEQDAATTQPLLDELAARDATPALHQAIGVVAGWQARALRSEGEAWRRFKARALPWTRSRRSPENPIA